MKGGANALPEMIDALVEGCRHVKNLGLAEQSSLYLVDAMKVMSPTFFTDSHDSLRNLFAQTAAECEGKRMKLKKAAITVLSIVKQSLPLEQALTDIGGLSLERA